jgi:hypothetical protein
MEEQPLSGSQQKIEEYAHRIKNGESKDLIFKDLPESFKSGIDAKLVESADEKIKRQEADQQKLEDVRKRLGITEQIPQGESIQEPKINYIDVVIDDEYMQKNLMPNGGLRMQGGQANWNGEVDLMRYSISENLSPNYRQIAEDKIEKLHAGQEKTYQHEAHHILNRKNDLTPHVAAENMREFLAFRVLDEMSAFATGELYNQDMTAENILLALETAQQKIIDSYYGQPFLNEATWYVSQHGNTPKALSREINQEKYHKIMRQYFNIKGHDILSVLQKANKMSEFTVIVNDLIGKLDQILNNIKN